MTEGLPVELVGQVEFDGDDGVEWYDNYHLYKLFREEDGPFDEFKLENKIKEQFQDNEDHGGLSKDRKEMMKEEIEEGLDRPVSKMTHTMVFKNVDKLKRLLGKFQKKKMNEVFTGIYHGELNEVMMFVKCDTSYDEEVFVNENTGLHKFPPRITKRMFGKIEKLTNDLHPSTNDIYEYEYLKFMISRGLVVDKIHRVDIYNVSYEMGDGFIRKQAEKRAKIKSGMDLCRLISEKQDVSDEELLQYVKQNEIDFIRGDPISAMKKYDNTSNAIKLSMNGVYGKTIENVERFYNNIITGNKLSAAKAIANPLYVQHKQLCDSENPLYYIKLQKREICLDKPIFMGKSILDKSKLSLMKFVKDLFDVYGVENVSIGATDTDSIHVKISGYSREECYNKQLELNSVMDRSKIKVDVGSCVGDETHAGELGSWKDEGGGVAIEKAMYHRAKQYIEVFEKYGSKAKVNAKSKGIPKKIIEDFGEEIFMNRGLTPMGKFSLNKINKDHKIHKNKITSVTKKLWGDEEDKVIRNKEGDYRQLGTAELLIKAINKRVEGLIEMYSKYKESF